jgi:hypothetical protein
VVLVNMALSVSEGEKGEHSPFSHELQLALTLDGLRNE